MQHNMDHPKFQDCNLLGNLAATKYPITKNMMKDLNNSPKYGAMFIIHVMQLHEQANNAATGIQSFIKFVI